MKTAIKKIICVSALFSFSMVALVALCQEQQEQQEKISPTLEQGIAQYKHENYDEALALLKKAREEAPESTLASYYLGLAYKQIQDYKNAVPCLRDAVTYSPKIKGALIELIDCLYQRGELEEAKKWLVEAEKEGIRPAQTAFLKGLVLVKDGDETGAVAAFENAKALDKAMAQACDYQIGICYLKEKKFTDARKAFEEVVLVDPSTNMASFANEYMDVLSKKEEAARPFKISGGVAWQYDDNVVLRPEDTSFATNISDKADSREVYTLRGEYDYRFNDMFGMKGLYSLYYSKQNDLGFYDMLSNSFIVQPNIYFPTSLLSFPSGYTHMLVNDKAYLSTPYTSGIFNFMVGNSNMGQLFVKYQNKDYLWTPSTPDENRDSNDLGGGCGWYFFYAKNKGFVNVRYNLNKEWTKGNNWEYLGNRVTPTVLVPVLDNLKVTVSGDIFVQNFDHTNTIYQTKRNDTTYSVSALVAYKFYKESELQLQYTYVKANSNISVYDYSRNIYSAGVEIKF